MKEIFVVFFTNHEVIEPVVAFFTEEEAQRYCEFRNECIDDGRKGNYTFCPTQLILPIYEG